MEKIIEKTERYPETIIGDVFRTQWNIKDEVFCKNSCLYLTVDYFRKTLHNTCFTGLWICLDKTKQDSNLCKLFFNYILSSHYYLAVRKIERNKTHAIKWNKWWKANSNMYHEATACSKKILHEIFLKSKL